MTFDLVYDIRIWSMISRIQKIYLDLFSWLKSFLKINGLIVKIWSTDKKSTNTQKVKVWLFGQHYISKIKIHQDIKKYQTWSSRIKKVKKVNKKSRFPILKKILSFFILDNFITSWHFFIKIQDGSKKTFNMKIIDLDEFYNFVLDGWCPKNA